MLNNRKFFRENFSGQDLSGQDLSSSKFICCNFNDTDISNANCSDCDFTGASLIGTKCTNTNFSHSCLACVFKPRDAMGITWTMNCQTFKGMQVSTLMWFCYLHFAMMMQPERDKEETLRDKLLLVFGADRYLRLKQFFKGREL